MDPQLFTALIMGAILILGLIFTFCYRIKMAKSLTPRSPHPFGQVFAKMMVPMMMTIVFCADTLLKAFLIYLGYLFAAILVSTDMKSRLTAGRSFFKQDK